MTREHLIEDLENVIALAKDRAGGDPRRLRSAFAGLARHVEAEGGAPERVRNCLAESIRVLDRAGESPDDDTWDYARACLEAALDYARAPASTP